MTTRTANTATIAHAAKDLASSAVRINNDTNGNPRYYIGRFDWLGALANAGYEAEDAPAMPNAGKYRGKQYGPGYVVQSCWLPNDCERAIVATLDKAGTKRTPTPNGVEFPLHSVSALFG